MENLKSFAEYIEIVQEHCGCEQEMQNEGIHMGAHVHIYGGGASTTHTVVSAKPENPYVMLVNKHGAKFKVNKSDIDQDEEGNFGVHSGKLKYVSTLGMEK